MAKKFKFYLYLLFSTIMFTLTSNFVHIISPAGTVSKTIFILSFITIFIFNNFSFKIYNQVLGINPKNRITEGILYSSLIGSILIGIVSIVNYTYSTKRYGNIERENILIYHTFIILIIFYILFPVFFLAFIYLIICSILCEFNKIFIIIF